MFKQPKRYKSYHEKSTQEASDALTLLKNKNFTAHATIIGMTGGDRRYSAKLLR